MNYKSQNISINYHHFLFKYKSLLFLNVNMTYFLTKKDECITLPTLAQPVILMYVYIYEIHF